MTVELTISVEGRSEKVRVKVVQKHGRAYIVRLPDGREVRVFKSSCEAVKK